MDSTSILKVVTDGLALVGEGIKFIQAQPLLLVPVGLAIGGMVIGVVKSNLTH